MNTIGATEHRYSALESWESQLSNALSVNSVTLSYYLSDFIFECKQFEGIGTIMKIPLLIESIL